ncbi:hypothetical protein [Mycobacterium sp. PSTR-4-N]|uniref:hypothetical protein n=1 Tax=Mycobacterium sp. PSTR-4-N TaxID=2917745 RepID=UPI001F1538B4|nr:hypothetical protein [Mycobacterium sp. PSTR-4-N]MCG7595908.1 hypothetical protein [Mycobacterium sp. PSTR-4-N]
MAHHCHCGARGAPGFLPLSFAFGGIEVNGLPPAVRGTFSVGDAGGGVAGVVAGGVVVVVVVVVVVDVSGALPSLELHPTASHVIAVRATPPATSEKRLVLVVILRSHLFVEPHAFPGTG